MTSGFGVDPTMSGSTITSGTTSDDIQKIFGALYSPGLVSGGAVTTSASAMTYTVSPGVAVVQMATGQNIPMPIPATTLLATTVPSSGARTDIIYATQRTPAIDGDSNVIVNYGPTLPPRSVALRTYTVPAGATNTNFGTATGNVDYAIPYGASLPQLYYWQNKYDGPLSNALIRQGQGTFYLPTDRNVRISVSAVLSAQSASGFDQNHYCEFGFLPNFDGNDYVLWSSPGLHQAWQTVQFSMIRSFKAGLHTTNLGLFRIVGPGTVLAHYGIDPAGFGRIGIEYTLEDAGVVQ